MKIIEIKYLSPIEDVNPQNDNIDVLVFLDDGRVYSFVIATPNNICWCMDNERIDYFFGFPQVFVRTLTIDNIEKALRAVVNEDGGKWLQVYGALQTQDEDQPDL